MLVSFRNNKEGENKMITFEVNKFETIVDCKHSNIGSYRSVCCEMSAKFHTGVYLLRGEIDMGGWAFTYSLAPQCEKTNMQNVSFLYNEQVIDIIELRKKVCYLGDISAYLDKPVILGDVIKKELEATKTNVTVEELSSNLDMNDWLNRDMRMLGSYVYRFTAAIGLAGGKKIFVMPWQGEYCFGAQGYVQLFDYLITKDSIIIFPLSNNCVIERNEQDKYYNIPIVSLLCNSQIKENYSHHNISSIK